MTDTTDTRSTIIEGEQTTAKIQGLDREQLEDGLYDQVKTMVDHEAFQNQVRIMPDCHPGAAATIGFSMPLGDRIVPNTVGSDIGCGMIAVNFGTGLDSWLETQERTLDLDSVIRDAVPLGYHVHDDTDYHMGEDFPWESCEQKRLDLERTLGRSVSTDRFESVGGYGIDYLKDTCRRVGYDVGRTINSVGTLGGGNHFIEVARDSGDDAWVVIHSGSRGIGLKIAEHWQTEATRRRENEFIREHVPEQYEQYVVPEMDDPALSTWFNGGKNRSYIDSEAIRADFEGEEIGAVHDAIRAGNPQKREYDGDTLYQQSDWINVGDLDYLDGTEMDGYLIDMIFAQTYAAVNRMQMIYQIEDAVDALSYEKIHSPHNLLDFEDTVIRKGATRAHSGERFIVPLNMAEGSLICEGRGNPEWNRTAPHGAGRIMSRTQAYNEVDMDEFHNAMDHVVSTSVTEDTKDESPQAYKDASLIESAISPTATIVDRLEPVLNIKANS